MSLSHTISCVTVKRKEISSKRMKECKYLDLRKLIDTQNEQNRFHLKFTLIRRRKTEADINVTTLII